jgi:hypothetical protein
MKYDDIGRVCSEYVEMRNGNKCLVGKRPLGRYMGDIKTDIR